MEKTPSAEQSASDRSTTEVRNFLPSFLIPFGKALYYLLLDARYHLMGNKAQLVPPPSNSGMANYLEIGQEFFGYFCDLGGLRPTDRVLDIGCATGRMALPLTQYLESDAAYEGFDIQEKQIRWAQKHIASKFANFNFRCVDVSNQAYSEKGRDAESFRFPYADHSFDFVFLTSVFTHMLPKDLKNYLTEIRRVLSPGGRCLATFFILNDDSRKGIDANASTIKFRFEVEGCLTDDPVTPEEAIAYDLRDLEQYFDGAGLGIDQPIQYGSWCGRDQFLSYQDIVVLAPK